MKESERVLKIIFACLIICSLLALTNSCIGPGLGDWRYKLSNDYEIWHVNSNNIKIGLKNGPNSIQLYDDEGNLLGIPAQVVEFCHNDIFVCAKTISAEQISAYKKGDNVQMYYYALNTKERIVYGPFQNETDFSRLLQDLSIQNLSLWKSTDSAPDEAI